MDNNTLPLFHDFFHVSLPRLLEQWGVSQGNIEWVSAVAGLAAISIVLWAFSRFLSWAFTVAMKHISVTTVTRFDDNLVTWRFPAYLGRIIPLVFASHLLPSVLDTYPRLIPPAERLIHIFFIVLTIRILRAFLNAGRDTLQAEDRYKGKPLGSYVQVLTLVLYILGGLAIFSQLTGVSIKSYLVSMGAASAVLLLVFKDTILGFVASIQISTNDMVRIGDWIEMPKYGADGDVMEINLTTVKVRNFDKSTTTIPTYALISDSFKNWRSMQTEGGRRLKRSLRIKIGSIRYLDENEVDELQRIELLKDYIRERHEEIKQYNATHEVDKSILVNGRNLTNVGLFRVYVERYLATYPGILPGMTLIARQLQPDDMGLPIELYCFSDKTGFEALERMAADIFDHLLAARTHFGLEFFERPSSDDIRFMGNKLAERLNDAP